MLLHTTPAEPGLRPTRAHGKPINTWRALAVRGMHRRFSWDALNVTKDTECGGTKCYFPASLQGEHGDEGWLVRLSDTHSHTFVHVRLVPSQSGAELGRLPRSCERTLEWVTC